MLTEKNIKDLQNICYSDGSTHVMKTCKIGDQDYFLKFSEESMFDENVSPDLQILIEYLSYRIYALYAGINVPKDIHLIHDQDNGKVGLATSKVPGKPGNKISREMLGNKMSEGVYVDILLANWDVIGQNIDNVLATDDGNITRIDPGGALTFRAQGGRKGKSFSNNPGELQTMLEPSSGAGKIFKYSDLKKAAESFNSVSWQQIHSTIKDVDNEVSKELASNESMQKLYSQWKQDVGEIEDKLKTRHVEISKNINNVLKEYRAVNKLIKQIINEIM